jgi:alpha(1,3/1,4) fucosyltransferase
MKKIALIPIYNYLEKNQIFNNSERDNIYEPMIKLRTYFSNEGTELTTLDDQDIRNFNAFIFYRIDLKLIIKLFILNKLSQTIYIQIEPEVVEPFHSRKNINLLSNIFGKVLTWNDNLINEHVFKYHIPMPHKNKNYSVPFASKKLLVNITSNKKSERPYELYSERLKLIEHFDHYYPEDFDLYGFGWQDRNFQSYNGTVSDKIKTLSNYKFALCLENMHNVEGYITEKIFDCFYANCIPVYLGATNIDKYVPSDTFIKYSDFKTPKEMYDFLINMTEKDYSKYINAIEIYLESKSFSKFLPKNYYLSIKDALDKLKTNRENTFFFIIELIVKKITLKLMR